MLPGGGSTLITWTQLLSGTFPTLQSALLCIPDYMAGLNLITHLAIPMLNPPVGIKRLTLRSVTEVRTSSVNMTMLTVTSTRRSFYSLLAVAYYCCGPSLGLCAGV